MEFKKIQLNNNEKWSKIRLDANWSIIKADPNYLYKKIMDIIFDKTNMYYYATQRKTSKTLKMAKKAAQEAMKNGTIEFSMKSIFENLGFTQDRFTLSNTQIHGDIGELVMANFIDTFCDPSTLICKLSLKTNPAMSVYGNDNIFHDYEKKILYYGEAKFHDSAAEALNDAINSLKQHNDGELSYIYNATNNFIAPNNKMLKKVEKRFETIPLNDITIANIIFIMNEDIYLKNDYESFINKYQNRIGENTILVLFPILSKKQLLEYFKENIKNYE